MSGNQDHQGEWFGGDTDLFAGLPEIDIPPADARPTGDDGAVAPVAPPSRAAARARRAAREAEELGGTAAAPVAASSDGHSHAGASDNGVSDDRVSDARVSGNGVSADGPSSDGLSSDRASLFDRSTGLEDVSAHRAAGDGYSTGPTPLRWDALGTPGSTADWAVGSGADTERSGHVDDLVPALYEDDWVPTSDFAAGFEAEFEAFTAETPSTDDLPFGATPFESAAFRETPFHEAQFDNAPFLDDAPFDSAPFLDDAPFDSAPFLDDAPFDSAPFDADRLRVEPTRTGPRPSEMRDAPASGHRGASPGTELELSPHFDPRNRTATLRRLEPNGAANLDGNLNILLSEAYRVAFRLLGDPLTAREIAVDATRTAASTGDSSAYRRSVVASAVDRALAWTPSGGALPAHAQHRARLRRDLARHNERDRCILGLRHLVGMGPGGVAATMGLDEESARLVTARWSPEDANTSSEALLRGIDNWIVSDDSGPDDTDRGDRSPLELLDDAMAPMFDMVDVTELGANPPEAAQNAAKRRNGRRH